MTTVQIQLPDELAQDAQAAGLLTPEAMAAMLREQLRSNRQLAGGVDCSVKKCGVERN